MAKHALFSPSSSSRWLNCTASIEEGKKIKKREKSSSYAEEGTAAHELLELCLNKRVTESSCYKNKTFNGYIPDQEMIDSVNLTLEELQRFTRDWGLSMKEIIAEQKVKMTSLHPELCFGTIDVTILDPENRRIAIVAFKYGKGVYVSPNNSQTKIYAIGVLDKYGWDNFDDIYLSIHQPRHSDYDPDPIHMSKAELKELAEEYKLTIQMIENGKATYKPSEETCRWCPAKANCAKLEELVMQTLDDDFNEQHTMTEKLELVPLIRTWCDSQESEALTQLMEGNLVPGYKLVRGRSIRKWGDVDLVEPILVSKLKTDAHIMKLVSPAQAQKLMGKKGFETVDQHVVTPLGKITIAPESDKRQAVNLQDDLAKDFDDM